jgi:VanZ family protein
MTQLVRIVQVLSRWLFWPGVILVTWGELTPHPPRLNGPFAWDKAEHFIAYFGLASMATMVVGLRPRLAWAIACVILYGGALEIIQGFVGRDAEVGDFIANSIGAFAGAAAAAALLRLPLVGAPAAD